jgi:hypothetical protein
MWVDQDTVGRNSNILLQNGQTDNSKNPDFIDMVRSGSPVPGHGNISFRRSTYTMSDTADRDSGVSQDAWGEIYNMRLSEKVSRFIYSYYVLGKRIRDIAIEENTTSQAIDQRHIQAKKTIAIRLDSRKLWNEYRERLNFKGILEYDVCDLYFGRRYPKKVIAKLMNRHISAIVKIIDNKISELHSL